MWAFFKQNLLVVLFGCLMVTSNSYAQNIQLTISTVDKPLAELQSIVILKQNFSSKKNCIEYISQLPQLLYAKGFISASIDDIKVDSATIKASLFVGDKFVWNKLMIKQADEAYLANVGIKPSIFKEQPFNPINVSIVQEKLLNYFVNNGYPFAEIKFDSLEIVDKKVNANLIINKGVLYKLDSIRQFGSIKLSKTFLYKYLDISPGSFYNEEKLKDINYKLSLLPYLQQKAPWQITMLGTGFLIDLYTDVKKSNQVDAIIGFLPNNQQTDGSLLFTADAKLNLNNAFGTGETIAANWQQIQPKSPRLNLQFVRPHILKSKFGLDFSLDLFKKDSSFFTIQSAIGVIFSNTKNQKNKILLQTQQSYLSDVDTTTIKLTKRLPDVADMTLNNIIAAFEWNNTNYIYNPQNGNELWVSITAGSKKLRKNNAITQIKDANFNYNSLYDNLQMQSYQLKLKAKMAHYFSVGKYNVIKAGLQTGLLQSPTIYKNEMFQIGGFKTLRGFDEESIYADKFAIATAEYRYLFTTNSYFNVFTDIGYTNNVQTNIQHNYIGFGGGLSFETKQGIINISIAAGKRNDLVFSLKQTKIHIGFVSVF